MRIPLDQRIAGAISGGEALLEALPEYRHRFPELYEQLIDELTSREEA